MQSSIMLECGRLPDFNPRRTACHYPRTEDEDLAYGLIKVTGQLELRDLLAPLEDPEALGASIARVSPGGEDLLFPCICCGNVGRSLRPRDEDEIEAALQIVGLQRSADGGGDLEGGLAKGYGGEGDTGWGDQSDCLFEEIRTFTPL